VTKMSWIMRRAVEEGWKTESPRDGRNLTIPWRRVFWRHDPDAVMEVRFETRGRVLDAIYYNPQADRDQYVMFGDQAKAETVEWILREVPLDLGERHALAHNTKPSWSRSGRIDGTI